MPIPIRMPRLSDGMDEGKVVAWPHALGARIEAGDVVLRIEVDKVEVEIEAVRPGFVRHHYAHPGDVHRSGTLLGVMTATPDEEFDPVAFEVEETTGF